MTLTFGTAAPLFGSTTAAPPSLGTATSLFGAAPTVATTSAPLFSAPAPAPASSSAPLFGAAPVASAAGSLFGAAAVPSVAATTAASLFGGATIATAAPSLFGTVPTATTTAAPLFGGATPAVSSSSSAAAPLFGATSAAATTTASLFGAPATAAGAGAKPLFGAPATTTATTSLFGAAPGATVGGGLFNTAPTVTAAAAPPSIGLGGTSSASAALGGSTGAAKGSSQETENIRESKLEQVHMELLQTVRKRMDENRKLADEFASSSNDECLQIGGRVKQLSRRLAALTSASSSNSSDVARCAQRSARDLHLGEAAARLHEQSTRGQYATASQQAIQYMAELVGEYDSCLNSYQSIVAELAKQLKKIQSGQCSLSERELSEHLKRFDAIFTTVAGQLQQSNERIQDLKDQFAEDQPELFGRGGGGGGGGSLSGSPWGRGGGREESMYEEEGRGSRIEEVPMTQIRGEEAMPSQSSLMRLGLFVKPQAGAMGATGVGGGGLFGTNTAGTTTGGLFSSMQQPKPFSFANTSTGSLFGAPATTAASTSLFSSPAPTSLFSAPATSTAGAAPATGAGMTFGKTLSNNASGLLFSGSAKPFGAK